MPAWSFGMASRVNRRLVFIPLEHASSVCFDLVRVGRFRRLFRIGGAGLPKVLGSPYCMYRQ